MAKVQSLQDPFLNALRKERVLVSIYLVNGIKLQGQIESFDQFVVLLKNQVSQMVYKCHRARLASTHLVMPSRRTTRNKFPILLPILIYRADDSLQKLSSRALHVPTLPISVSCFITYLIHVRTSC